MDFFFKAKSRKQTGPFQLPGNFLRLEILESRLTPTSAYDPNSLLIRLSPNVAGVYPTERLSLMPGLVLDHAYDLVPGLWRAKLVGGSIDVQSAIAALSTDPRVAYAVANGENQAESVPNDPRFASQWHLAQPVGPSIHASDAWESFTGSGVTVVAIFDTGIDLAHPDLKSRIWTNGSEISGDNVDNDGNGIVDDLHGASFFQGTVTGSVQDSDGHGTAVAGLIGATGNNGIGVSGVNWAATLLPLKVIQNGQALDGDILQAMDYAAKAGAKIWNLSLGGGAYSRAMADAFDAASHRGFIVVSAAGNNAQNNDTNPHFPSSYTAENVIAVAATDGADKLARFSNFGVASVDIAAPGTNLLTTLPGGNYGTRQGTSMAAALVTGALSLIWDRTPGASAGQILDTLMNSSKSLDSLKGAVQSGSRLDIGALNQKVVDARNPFVPINQSNTVTSTPISNPGGPLPGTKPSVPDLYQDPVIRGVTTGPTLPVPIVPGRPITTPPVLVTPPLPIVTPPKPGPLPLKISPPAMGTPGQPSLLPNPILIHVPVYLPDPGTMGPDSPSPIPGNKPVVLPVQKPVVVPGNQVIVGAPFGNGLGQNDPEPVNPVPPKELLPVTDAPIPSGVGSLPVGNVVKSKPADSVSLPVTQDKSKVSPNPKDEVWSDYPGWEDLGLWDISKEDSSTLRLH